MLFRSLLGEFVGLCGVSGHVESKVEDGARVAFVEDGEGFVTAYGEGSEEGLVVKMGSVWSGWVCVLREEKVGRNLKSEIHGYLSC